MSPVYNNIIETIGNTPLVKLNRIAESVECSVYVKLESFNPGSSVKDRIAISMIDKAENEGIIGEWSVIVEPTSGNTGIGLALVCAAKGYKLILTMPESMSLERRKILQAYGAELVLTPASGGMTGAINKAKELSKADNNVFIPQQFKNMANPEIHKKTTGEEIIRDLDGKVNGLVSGIGTGGTITGIGQVLKEKVGDHVKIYAVEPEGSPILKAFKGKMGPGPHKIQGIGAGFIPEVLDTKIYHKVIHVNFDKAAEASRNLAKMEGIFVGISSGAATWAALNVAAADFKKGDNLVVICPDTGERYLSTPLFT
jgi:cysteine synthase A